MWPFHKKSPLHSLRADTGGAVAVEFAFLFPLHLMLVLAIVDVGIMEFASTELQGATASAVRQIRTGAVQQAPVPSTPAQNGLGITIDAEDTTAIIFHKLLCSKVLENPNAYENPDRSGLIVDCNKIVFDIRSYSSFAALAAAGLGNLVYVDGAPNVEFPDATVTTTGFSPGSSDQIIAARVWYRREFMVPWIGRLVGGDDGGTTLEATVVIKAEPW